MAIPDFGVDATQVSYHMGSQSYTDWADRFEVWRDQAYTALNQRLKMQGYSAVEAAAQGSESDVYLLCQRYLTLKVAADAVRSTSRDDGTQARSLRQEAAETLLSLEQTIESIIGDGIVITDHRATPRGNRYPAATAQTPGVSGGFWAGRRDI